MYSFIHFCSEEQISYQVIFGWLKQNLFRFSDIENLHHSIYYYVATGFNVIF